MATHFKLFLLSYPYILLMNFIPNICLNISRNEDPNKNLAMYKSLK